MSNKLITIFSDVHFGIEGNSEQRLDDAMRAVEWMCSEATEAGSDVCVFAGDWFHHRDEIDVRTAAVAKEAMKKVASSFRRFYLIAGNHDFYYNNSPSVSSVSLFSDVGGMMVVSENPVEIDVNGRSVVLVPWFSDLKSLGRGFDAMVGHFEFIGGAMAGGFSKVGLKPSEIVSVAPLTFTGHYHLTNEQHFDGRKIVTIGSLYQQDWGDAGDQKRFLLFDGETYRSVYNSVSPKFVKVPYSKLAGLADDVVRKVFENQAFMDASVKIASDSQDADHDRMMRLVEIASSVKSVRSAAADHEGAGQSLVESVEDGLDRVAQKDVRSYVMDFIGEAAGSLPEYSSVDVEAARKEVSSYFDRLSSASLER